MRWRGTGRPGGPGRECGRRTGVRALVPMLLNDHMQVRGATFDNGLLKIELVREIPEAMKPRRIAIGQSTSNDNKRIEQNKAA
jgi:hypothetical protein